MIPSVSVVTPIKKFQKHINHCINSVFSQNYSGDIYHYVIVDEINTFDNFKIVNPNLIIRKNNGLGISAARNTALLISNSDFIFFLDSDDIWPIDYIKNIINIYTSSPEIACISSSGYFFRGNQFINKLVVPFLSDGYISPFDVAWNAIGCPSGFSYRYTFKSKSCFFNTSIDSCEDFLFYLELLASDIGYFYKTNITYFLYQSSDFQLSNNQNNLSIEKTLQIFKELLLYGSLKHLNIYMKFIVYFSVLQRTSSLFKRSNPMPYFFYSFIVIVLRPKALISHFTRRFVKNSKLNHCKSTIEKFARYN